MEVILLWLDELDDLVFGLALLSEPLRRIVLQIGLGAAVAVLFSPPTVPFDGILAGIASASVLAWLVAFFVLAARGDHRAGPAAA
jgi:hypothetical protein